MAKINNGKLSTAYVDYIPIQNEKLETEDFQVEEEINSFPDMSIYY